MTWEPVEREVQFWSEFCFNRFSGSAMKWPRSSSACGAGRWNLFLRSSFPHGPPSPPPSHPGSGAARAEYASRSPHRPIQLFTARSPGNQLGRQQVRYFRLENCPFVRRDQRCLVRGKSECDYDTRAPEIQIDPPQPCWCFPCDSQEKSVLTKRTFVKSKFDKNAFGWGKNNSNTFFRQKYHKIKFGYCKILIQTSKTTIIDIRLYVDKKLLFQGISCRRWA